MRLCIICNQYLASFFLRYPQSIHNFEISIACITICIFVYYLDVVFFAFISIEKFNNVVKEVVFTILYNELSFCRNAALPKLNILKDESSTTNNTVKGIFSNMAWHTSFFSKKFVEVF